MEHTQKMDWPSKGDHQAFSETNRKGAGRHQMSQCFRNQNTPEWNHEQSREKNKQRVGVTKNKQINL